MGRLDSAPKTGAWANCRRTASTRGGITCNGRTKADRGEEGLTWPNAPPTRREARTPDTGQGQNTAGEDKEGGEHSKVCDRPETRAENSKQRRRRKQRPHPNSKGEEASIVADSRGGEQKLNQLLAKTHFCE